MINVDLIIEHNKKYYALIKYCGLISGIYLISISHSYADIIVDGSALLNQQATITTHIELKNMCKEQNARCQGGTYFYIDIVTPDKHGLSHNKYRDFSNEKGHGYNKIIFNNILSDNKESTGNPHLIDKTAKVILNEVTGKQPSELYGSLFVEGDKAHVIIANLSGISCDSCRFNNTGHVTLTTGIPVTHAGRLIGYDVNHGAIQIKSGGLRQSSYSDTFLDLFAHSLKIDGELIGNDILAIIGKHAVSFAPIGKNIDIRPIGGFTSDYQKSVNVEVSRVGKIYADRIFINTNGGSLSNKGLIDSDDIVKIFSSASIKNSGKIMSRKVALRGADYIDNSGGYIKTERQSYPFDTKDKLSIRMFGGDIFNRGGNIYSNSGNISLKATELVDNNKGMIKSNSTSGPANINIKSRGLNNSIGSIITSSDIDISTSRLNNNRGKIISVMGRVDLTYRRLTEHQGAIHGGLDVYRTIKH